MSKDLKILILGSAGLVGNAITNNLKENGYTNLLTPKRNQLNLLRQLDVEEFFKDHHPDWVINAAAKVGGIYANNTYRTEFLHENLVIQNNLFGAALATKTPNFMFLGSSCIYPKQCPQPIKEDYLLTSPLENTNEPYAIAKIAGLKMAENIKAQYGLNYFSLMPTNLYGPNDNFHPKNSHVIPALIQRLNQTIENGDNTFEVWGTGNVKREFLYVDDLADACRYFLEYPDNDLESWINVGTGQDITIRELAQEVCTQMNFKGEIVFNTEYPDGTPRKILDVTRLHSYGWRHKTSLQEGLKKTIDYYLSSNDIRRY